MTDRRGILGPLTIELAASLLREPENKALAHVIWLKSSNVHSAVHIDNLAAGVRNGTSHKGGHSATDLARLAPPPKECILVHVVRVLLPYA